MQSNLPKAVTQIRGEARGGSWGAREILATPLSQTLGQGDRSREGSLN